MGADVPFLKAFFNDLVKRISFEPPLGVGLFQHFYIPKPSNSFLCCMPEKS